MNHPRTLGPIARRLALWGLVALALLTPTPAAGGPEGQLTWGVHLSLVTRWLDPGEMEGILTPFLFYYALHDALVKPMPGHAMAPSLAESWTMGKDALSYDFVLRKGVRFHNGDPVTAEDVKFTFERYKGAGGKLLREKVREVQVVDPGRVRFHLREPWPDFMTFYGTSATGAGWIVPKKYVDRVGEDGFKKAPVGAGPYRFVSFTPGVELVLEAFEGYWRKTPNVKRLVLRAMPEETTRAAALKKGEVDIVYLLSGPEAGEGAPRRGRLSGRFRRGRLPPLPALLLDGRGAGRLSPGRRDPDADQDDGARGLPDRVAGEDAARGPARDHGRVGQRGHAAGGVRDEDRHLRLRGPPGGRGPLPPPGAGARPEKAGGAAASDPEGRPRPRVARTDLPAGVSLRYRPARRGVGDGVDARLRVLRAVRRSHPPKPMRRFILRRLGLAVVSLFLLSVTIFFFVRVTGDPAVLLVEPGATQADLDAIRQQFGLDQSLPVQYGSFIAHLARGDFGQSFYYRTDVLELYLSRLPASLLLATVAMVFSLAIGLPTGIVAAVRVNGWWDSAGKIFALLGLSMPSFWVGLLMILFFSVYLGWLPSSGSGTPLHVLMPAFALGWYFAAAHMRLTRSSMLEVLGSEYIKLARLKGLPETLVICKHAFKNALIPVLTLAGINLVLMINVAVVVETVFAWPGVGRLLYEGITFRDFPVVQAVVLLGGIMIVAVNLLMDILYAVIDPRIRLER